MRLAILAALALAPAGIAAAPPPASLPLAADEVLLEIDAIGSVTTPADRVTVTVPVVARAPTAREARRQAEADAERLRAAARAFGIAAADVEVTTGSFARFGFVGNAAPDYIEAEAAGSASRAEHRHVEIRLRDPARFNGLRDALEAAGARHVSQPVYSLADEGAARRAAKDAAVRAARAEADAYARGMDMRVLRVVRVSERVEPRATDLESIQVMYRVLTGVSGGPSDPVETSARVSVDFVLGPRR